MLLHNNAISECLCAGENEQLPMLMLVPSCANAVPSAIHKATAHRGSVPMSGVVGRMVWFVHHD
jgi:hypothetical protein